MMTRIRQHAIQIVIISLVFLLFLSNAAGLLEFHWEPGSGLRFFSSLFGPGGSVVLPAVARSGMFLLLLLTGLVMCLFLPLLSPIRASLLTLAAAAPPLLLGFLRPGTGAGLPMEFALLTIGILFAVNALVSYFRETRSKQEILSVFGQFVPPEVVAEISRQPERFALDGESRRLTVFFCDLQNFSGVAEQLNPKQLTLLLNEYFNAMTEVLYRYGATIDKYIGDSIMAFWGAPLPMADHARRAILASFEMHAIIKELAQSFMRRGWPGPTMGIGINTGVMSVGNMGSRYRVAYTVVGDAVNLASRLESLTRSYQVATIVGEQTREECDDIAFRTLDIVQVRGKHNRTRIYEPLCLTKDLDDARRVLLENHERGMERYLAEDFQAAASIFEELAKADPKDPLYPVLLRKISEKPHA